MNFVEEEATKFCPKCEQDLPVSAFGKRSASADGLAAKCKECTKAYQQAYRAANPEKTRERSRTQYTRVMADPVRRAAQNDRTREYQRRPEVAAKRSAWGRAKRQDPEWVRQENMRQRLYKYGLTLEQFQQMLEDQGFLCAICGCDLSELSFNNIHIDHDHSCCPTERSCGECVRKLLCRACNYLLGNAKDDPDILRAAIEYLLSNQRVCASDGGSAAA